MNLELNGKTAVVIGGSRGIGKAIALRFAEEGANVAICARGDADLRATGEILSETGVDIHAGVCDASDAQALEGFLDGTKRLIWIGGASRAGKSTVAKRLAETYGFGYLSGDAAANAHVRSAPESSPSYEVRLSLDDREASTRYLCTSAQHIADTNFARAAEEYELIKKDVTAVQTDRGVIVDAFLLPPSRAVEEVDRADLMFLFSTEEFQRERWIESTWYRKYTDNTEDPELAVSNFIESGIVVSRELLAECKRVGAPFLITGGVLDLSEVYERVCAHLVGYERSYQ